MSAGESRRPARKGSWVLPTLTALFIAVPIIEIWLLIQVGGQIGVGWTIGLVILAAVVGAWLAKREGALAWRRINESIHSGKMPQREIVDGALVLAGGIMLVFPGFFSDVVGILLLLPVTRPVFRGLLMRVLSDQAQKYTPPIPGFPSGTTYPPPGRTPGRERHLGGDVIPGEVIDEDPDGRRR